MRLKLIFVCGVLQVNLTTLDVASNRIKVVENVSHLLKLEEFWVCVCVHMEFIPKIV